MWKQKTLFVLSRELNANLARLFFRWHFFAVSFKPFLFFRWKKNARKERIMKLMWGSRLEIDSVRCKYFYWCIIMESLTLCRTRSWKYLRFRFAFLFFFCRLKINKSQLGVILEVSLTERCISTLFAHSRCQHNCRSRTKVKSCFWKMQINSKMVQRHWQAGQLRLFG